MVAPGDVSMTAAALVLQRYGPLPHMGSHHAAQMEAFIREHRFANCLELGFKHGKSSAVIAATLRALGRGRLTTVDHVCARAYRPNIDEVLAELGLAEWVTIHYEPRSYTWRLMKLIEAHRSPVFDFCYLDGAHSWDADGLAFFLVDRLLVPGGWLLLDDLDWTYGSMEARFGQELPDWLQRMPEEERATAQVRKVWELLVRRHPGYEAFREDGQWGFARKRPGGT